MLYKKHLIRVVDDAHVRYYNMEIVPTLFGEILLEREYGSVRHKHPTRVIKNYFEDIQIARKLFEKTLGDKIKRGYAERLGQWI